VEQKLDIASYDETHSLHQPRTTGLGKKRPDMFELALGGDVKAAWAYGKSKLGAELKASDVLKQGEDS